MHLFSLARFSQRFGIDLTVDDFENAVVEASRAATSTLASRLRFTDFDEYTARRDMFYVDRTFGDAQGFNRQFMLQRGFTSTANVTAYYSSSPVNLRNADTDLLTSIKDTAEDGESNFLVVDGNQGLLTVYGINLTGLWVLVDYDGGLSVATDDEYDNVPEWLSEAAMAQAAINLSHHRALKADDDDADFSDLRSAVVEAMSTHARIAPAALKPTASEPGN